MMESPVQIILKRAYVKGEEKIALFYAFNHMFNDILKKRQGKFNYTLKCWILENTPENMDYIYQAFDGRAVIDRSNFDDKRIEPLIDGKGRHKDLFLITLPKLPEEVKNKLLKFKYLLRSKRYSSNTIENYIGILEGFFRFHSNVPTHKIRNEHIILFNEEYILKRNLSVSYQRQSINALKLFYEQIQDKELKIEELIRPKKEKKLPVVLDQNEVKKILEVTRNLKHRTALIMIYSCGLRREELISLKPGDIDSARNVIWVRRGKGAKDRQVPLSQKVLTILREYFKAYRPKTYLFEGEKPGQKYSEHSLAKVFKKSLKLSGVRKEATLHTLRHSYATHLLERSTDIRTIQVLLGHNSLKTTEIYTHISTNNIKNVISPFDSLDL